MIVEDHSPVDIFFIFSRQRCHFLDGRAILNFQTALELFACIMLTPTYILEMVGVYRYKDSGPAEMATCILFKGRTLASLGHNGSTACLVALTIDRYWKIVHPVHHRKHYRPWMLYVGLFMPWLNGAATYLLPALGTSGIVNGTCIAAGFWPSKVMAKVRRFFLNKLSFC